MDLIFKEESYQIIGICLDVHSILGKGFSEIVYKDAIEYELKRNNIKYEREKEYKIPFKEIILPHSYFADFVVFDKIIMEIKSIDCLSENHNKQALNYLAASKLKLALIINFGEDSLKFKRVVL